MGFEFSYARVVKHEGGFTDNPKDPGNWTGGLRGAGELKGTKYGISARQYPDLDIKNLTPEQAKAIYKRDYWDVCKGDQLPAGVAHVVFDAAINHGCDAQASYRAQKFLQDVVGALPDGDIGPKTLAAVAQKRPDEIITAYQVRRIRFYRPIKTADNQSAWLEFGEGWAVRALLVQAEALAL